MAAKAMSVCGVALVLAILVGQATSRTDRSTATVAYVLDGDTIVLAGGARVRLVQIDAPELGSGECYSRRSANELRRLLPVGTAVRLEADARLDRVDSYGRLLRYVHRGSLNVNVALVRRGAATVWFYGGDRGRYARLLLYAARRARAERRGMWAACRTIWNPYGPATAGFERPSVSRTQACDASYPTVCIPPPPPDLDCGDVRYRRFKVRPPDPHRFDGDGDGLGCER